MSVESLATDHATVSRVIRSRRSIRHYRLDPVPAPLLRELVELALEAPSSFNLRARSVVVVSGAWSERFAAASPEDARLFHEDLRERGLEREYAVKDAMIAASFLMVAAEAAGLATSPMNGWDEDAVKKAVGIDGRDDLHIALLVPLGHPAESRRHSGRRDRSLTCFRETYGR
ncbi:nitroreductase family protein [Streptomyces sp. NPDC050549]|uniref:nitroreductase family protein n=1 Tax=Streptomyces sp. NPDC050549 TaxID=3155406 RepID=UPI00342E6302